MNFLKMRYCVFIALLSATISCYALDFGTRNAALYQFEEWTITNTSYSGNPFDIIATATFTHEDGTTSNTTELYYAGSDTWKFRFTASKTGNWSFTTQSTDPELDGHTGMVSSTSNTDTEITGFLTTIGNKFAIQKGPEGELSGYLLNIFNGDDNGVQVGPRFRHTFLEFFKDDPVTKTNQYIDYAQEHGMNAIYVLLSVTLNDLDLISGFPDSQNPDLSAFAILDTVLMEAHKKGMHVYFWRWGDKARKMSSTVLEGGKNGSGDNRITRYLASRIGALPNWSMGYGFDLHEWINGAELNTWENYFHQQLGFPHLLSARSQEFSSTTETITGYAQGDSELGQSMPEIPTYSQILNRLNQDVNRGHLLEERNVLARWGINSQETLELMWDLAMAGGMGGWFGYFGERGDGGKTGDPIWSGDNLGGEYKNPAAMRTHHLFWKNRFELSYSEANTLSSNGVKVLKSTDNTKYILYKENTSSMNINLSSAASSLHAIAIDANAAYQEVDLGQLSSTNQTITLPYSSNWAIALGSFSGNTPVQTFDLIVNEGTGSGTYVSGNAVVIAANAPAAGQTFDEWEGDVNLLDDITASTTTLTITNFDATVTATYKDLPSYTLTVGNGTGSGTYTEGSVVNITANNPTDGFQFDAWQGDILTVADINSANTTITITDSDLSINASYAEEEELFSLIVNNGQGSGSYTSGTVVSISANSAPIGQQFANWTGNVSSISDINAQTTSIVIDTVDMEISATYEDVIVSTETIQVNFQKSNFNTPQGYIADGGDEFGDRGNGYSYGWLGGRNRDTRKRNNNEDPRLISLNHIQKNTNRIWEIALPNGEYALEIACGDPSYTDQINTLDVEGNLVVDPDGEDNFDFYQLTVNVSDGHLTLTQGTGGSNAKICYLHITGTNSSTRSIDNGTSESKMKGTKELILYPQPAKNFITIENSVSGIAKLVNIQGVIVDSYSLSSGKQTIRVAKHKPGLYTLLFQNRSYKILIQP